MGVSFFVMVFGRSPFEAKDKEEMLKLNEKAEINLDHGRMIIKISSSGLELMQKMLEKDPEKRPSASTLINHHWFVNIRSKKDGKGGKKGFCSLPTINTIQ